MKQIFKYAFALVASALVLASCTEEYDYTPAAAYEGYYLTASQTDYSFQPTEAVQTYIVKLVRSNAAAAERVVLQGDNDAFSFPSAVSFEAGQTEAEFTVTSQLVPGQSETLHIYLPEGTYDLTYFGGYLTITAEVQFVWEEAGTATFYERVFAGFNKQCTIKHAVGTNMYVLEAPYAEGYDLTFYLDEDYNALEVQDPFPTGYSYSSYGMVTFRYIAGDANCAFTNEGNEFTVKGYATVSADSFGAYANYFDWDEGYPGE
ncbi:MAG: hypothetical protein J6M53_05640 [Bacteroidaceae bacterium]|nr:hypothetical protein [Bacteroidaceae bacterium]